MTRFLTHRRSLAIVVLLLLVSCIARDRWSTGAARLPARIIQAVAAPLQWPLHRAGAAVRGPGRTMPPLNTDEAAWQVQAGEALRYIGQLEEQLRVAEERLAMLTQAQEMGLTGATHVEARVTGVAGDATRPVLLIDKGSSRGVTPDAPVVFGVNLVGRVQDVSPATARVELITAGDARLFARIGPPRTQDGARQLREQLRRSPDGPWFEAQVTINAPVEVGDWATLVDELWPSEAFGYVIGTVSRVEEDPRNPLQFKRLIVEPMPRLAQLRTVVVRAPAR